MSVVGMCISGGQTGADQGGLQGAEDAGVPTGGMAPKGWRTEGGSLPALGTKYRLSEGSTTGYRERTLANVTNSDATLIFGNFSPGSALTRDLAVKLERPVRWVNVYTLSDGLALKDDTIEAIREWIEENSITVLNVAGNRESVTPGIQKLVRRVMAKVLA